MINNITELRTRIRPILENYAELLGYLNADIIVQKISKEETNQRYSALTGTAEKDLLALLQQVDKESRIDELDSLKVNRQGMISSKDVGRRMEELQNG